MLFYNGYYGIKTRTGRIWSVWVYPIQKQLPCSPQTYQTLTCCYNISERILKNFDRMAFGLAIFSYSIYLAILLVHICILIAIYSLILVILGSWHHHQYLPTWIWLPIIQPLTHIHITQPKVNRTPTSVTVCGLDPFPSMVWTIA